MLWGAPPNDNQRALIHLPARVGGFGIPEAKNVAWSAYTGSLIQTVELQNKLLGRPPISNGDLPVPVVAAMEEWRSVHGFSPEALSVRDLLVSKHPQSVLTEKVNSGLRAALLEQSTGHFRTLLEARNADSSLWTRVWPQKFRGTTMHPIAFRHALQFQVGMDVYTKEGACACGSISYKNGSHDALCTKGARLVKRHDAIRDMLYDEAVRAGVAESKETKHILGTDSLERPADVLFAYSLYDTRAQCVDVTVVTPFSAPVKPRDSDETLDHIQQAERAKITLYRERCEQRNYAFKPLVLDAFGRRGSEADEVLKLVAKRTAEKEDIPEGKALHNLLSRLSFYAVKLTAASLVDRCLKSAGSFF